MLQDLGSFWLVKAFFFVERKFFVVAFRASTLLLYKGMQQMSTCAVRKRKKEPKSLTSKPSTDDFLPEDKLRITKFLFKAETIPRDFEFTVTSYLRCGIEKGKGVDWNEDEGKIIDLIRDTCRTVNNYKHAAVLMQLRTSLEALFDALSVVISERNIIKLDSQEGLFWPPPS